VTVPETENPIGPTVCRALPSQTVGHFEKASENQKNQSRSNTLRLGEGAPFSQTLIPFWSGLNLCPGTEIRFNTVLGSREELEISAAGYFGNVFSHPKKAVRISL